MKKPLEHLVLHVTINDPIYFSLIQRNAVTIFQDELLIIYNPDDSLFCDEALGHLRRLNSAGSSSSPANAEYGMALFLYVLVIIRIEHPNNIPLPILFLLFTIVELTRSSLLLLFFCDHPYFYNLQ